MSFFICFVLSVFALRFQQTVCPRSARLTLSYSRNQGTQALACDPSSIRPSNYRIFCDCSSRGYFRWVRFESVETFRRWHCHTQSATDSIYRRPAPIGLVSLHFDFPFVRGDKSNRSHLCRMFGKWAGFSSIVLFYSDRKCISCQKTTVPIISDLSKCGGDRGNRAPALMRPDCASLRPLAVHKYVFGPQSCTIRLA